MQQYQNPNAAADAPVVRQIVLVLVGFMVMTAIIATVITVVMH